jgi:hypothetical protein
MIYYGRGRDGGDLHLCTMADTYLKLTVGRYKRPSELEWGCDWCDFCKKEE